MIRIDAAPVGWNVLVDGIWRGWRLRFHAANRLARRYWKSRVTS